jgi:hypothetical protein
MWDIYDLEQAVRQGSVDCVVFALEHGCLWDPQVRGSNLGQCTEWRVFNFYSGLKECLRVHRYD